MMPFKLFRNLMNLMEKSCNVINNFYRTSPLLNFQQKRTDETEADGKKDVKIMVLFKLLTNLMNLMEKS